MSRNATKSGKSGKKAAVTPLFNIGDKVFVYTVSVYYVGEVVAVNDEFVTLKKAAWLACTGRFTQFIANGEIDECEPYPETMEVKVLKQAIVGTCPWLHALPLPQK